MSISKADLAKLKAMRQFGGSFAAAIAEAWLRADSSNQAKLEREFRDMLDDYAAFVKDPAQEKRQAIEYIRRVQEDGYPCRYGHYHCAAFDGGPCSDEMAGKFNVTDEEI